jgi:hypothetical protein
VVALVLFRLSALVTVMRPSPPVVVVRVLVTAASVGVASLLTLSAVWVLPWLRTWREFAAVLLPPMLPIAVLLPVIV